MSDGLDRYREIVADWGAFRRAARSPEPTTIRLRRGEVGPSTVTKLRERGFGLEKVPGMPDFFRTTREPFPVSKTLEHWVGDIYIQQASAGVAAPALGARPGERVLDLCAAPGGKTTYLADGMEDSGLVVAADSNTNRIRALLANVYRLGHPNVLAVECDGRTFPGGALFDRVLVDVPCSGEGNVRRHGGEVGRRSDSFTAHVTSVQKDLLRRALDLVAPGGVVLYSTCTFAPEENEAVVDEVLESGGAALEPIELDLPHAPGLTSFRGRTFREDLSLAWRIYPHHLDSGGLFLARLRREGARSGRASEEDGMPGETGGSGGEVEGSGDGSGWERIPDRFPDTDSEKAESGSTPSARERIEVGVSGTLDHFGVEGPVRLRRGPARWVVRGDSIWLHGSSRWPVPAWDPEGDWRVLSLGIRALKRDPRTTCGERPTSDFLRMLEDDLRRRVLELSEEEILDVLARSPAAVPASERGFVALRYRGRILGRGWVRDEVLSNEISKARSQRLRADLRAARKAREPAREGEGDGERARPRDGERGARP